MTLSFREQAAIALHILGIDTGLAVHAHVAVTSAQLLADEACKAWGHTIGSTLDERGIPLSEDELTNKPCVRCGKDIAE